MQHFNNFNYTQKHYKGPDEFSTISGTQRFVPMLTTKHQSVHKSTEMYLKEKVLPP